MINGCYSFNLVAYAILLVKSNMQQENESSLLTKKMYLFDVHIIFFKIGVFYHLKVDTAQEMRFSIKDFFSKCDQKPKFPADLVTFTEEILNRKLHFFAVV